MYKTIKIICNVETTIKHLLNNNDFDIYEAIGNEDIFTMIKKKNEEWTGTTSTPSLTTSPATPGIVTTPSF